jgi:pyruvate formate lyase activating enzyme
VSKDMKIKTEYLPQPPLRIVGGFQGHTVGGVGTPWEAKNQTHYVEVACFAAGCNFRCPQCQNWTTTYTGNGEPLTPHQAAIKLTRARHKYAVNRMAISGGESTLNRQWLVNFISELKRLNPDPRARFHVDTNGSLLTPDYVEELVAAGMTDVGIDLKALKLNTFQRITGLKEPTVCQFYLDTAWEAVRYLRQKHQHVFLGIGFPYNRQLISKSEIVAMGKRLAELAPDIQVTVLDYRPEFRAQHLTRPSVREMKEIRRALKRCGLKKVLCQTPVGHIGP